MKTKLLTALLLIGIAAWAGVQHYGPAKGDKNLQVITDEITSTLTKEETPSQMGVYSAQASRNLAVAVTRTFSYSRNVNGRSVNIARTFSRARSPTGRAVGYDLSYSFSGPGKSISINKARAFASGVNPIVSTGSQTNTGARGARRARRDRLARRARRARRAGPTASGGFIASSGGVGGAFVAGSTAVGHGGASAVGFAGAGGIRRGAGAKAGRILSITGGVGVELKNLAGQYEFVLDPIPVLVSNDYIIFRGCNDYTISITRNGQDIEFSDFVETDADCGYDPAYYLAQRFYQVTTYDKYSNGFVGFADDEELFSIIYKAGVKRGNQVYGYYEQGEYEAQLPIYNIQIENNRLWFQGYKDRALEFDYSNDGSISFERYLTDRDYLGQYDRDSSLYDLFSYIARVNARGQNNGYQFADQDGTSLAYCSPRKW